MKRIALALLLLRSICVLSQVIPEKPNPKVRAITAFVRLDRTNVLKQIETRSVFPEDLPVWGTALSYVYQIR